MHLPGRTLKTLFDRSLKQPKKLLETHVKVNSQYLQNTLEIISQIPQNIVVTSSHPHLTLTFKSLIKDVIADLASLKQP